MDQSLSLRHFLLALLVVGIWGTNFVVIHVGLEHLPPLLFAALRFLFAFFPAMLVVRRPRVALGNLAAFGLFIGVGQFGVLFIAMNGWISPGLASLIVQSQVLFTIGLALVLQGEPVRGRHLVSLALGIAGVGVIAANTGGSATGLGLVLVLCAGFSWACGNIVSKRSGATDMLAYVVWSSAFAVPPLLALSLFFEGPDAILAGLRAADLVTWATVVWQALGNALIGYGAWSFLLSRYPAATITPTALLVPVFGMGASFLFLGEPLESWKLLAAFLVMAALAVGLLYRPKRVPVA